MGGKKKIEVQTPETPTFETDPRFSQGIDQLFGLGENLTNFDFAGGTSPLAQTIALDPEFTRLSLQQAQSQLDPIFEDSLRAISNEAAANNQLQSSTFTDALAREAGRRDLAFQGIAAGAALQDRSRALANTLGLFGQGLGLIESGTGFAGSNQSQQNAFNLGIFGSEFENALAKAALDRGNQPGGVAGGITGAIGGGAKGASVGSVFGPIGSIVGAVIGAGTGGYAGATGTPGTGGSLLNSGSSSFGNFLGSRAQPGSTSTNNRIAQFESPNPLLLQDLLLRGSQA